MSSIYTTPQQFTKYFNGIRNRTIKYIQTIPEDLGEWRPQKDKFSFCELIRHLGSTEKMFFTVIQSGDWHYSGHDESKGKTIQEALQYLNACHDEVIQGLALLTESDLLKLTFGPSGEEVVTWKILNNMAEHEIHHRGQLSAYLQINAIDPPQIFGRKVEEFIQIN